MTADELRAHVLLIYNVTLASVEYSVLMMTDLVPVEETREDLSKQILNR